MENQGEKQIPKALKNLFVFHFVLDIIFAIPMIFMTNKFLNVMGWEFVLVVAPRFGAAAQFAIIILFYIDRDSPIEASKNMINFKIMWSFTVIFAIIVSFIKSTQMQTIVVNLILILFVASVILWIYWRIKLNNSLYSGYTGKLF